VRAHPALPSFWFRRLFSLLAVLVLLQPLQSVSLACLGSSVLVGEGGAVASDAAGEAAESDGCCPSERSSEPSDEPHQNCPCPFPCAVGCGGPPRAIVSAIALPALVALPAAVVFTPAAQRAPPNPEPVGIMHVPILAAT
jgi:hypothetical protein